MIIIRKESMKGRKKMTENKVIIKNGQIQNILSESTLKNGGRMNLEDARKLLHDFVNKLKETYGQ